MPRYRFTQTYRSSYGAGRAGDVVDVAADFAAAINRDAPGTLEPVADDLEPETRAPDRPSRDRQVKRPARKRGAA